MTDMQGGVIVSLVALGIGAILTVWPERLLAQVREHNDHKLSRFSAYRLVVDSVWYVRIARIVGILAMFFAVTLLVFLWLLPKA